MVMMYVKYPLSLLNVEDLLAERGIEDAHLRSRYGYVKSLIISGMLSSH